MAKPTLVELIVAEVLADGDGREEPGQDVDLPELDVPDRTAAEGVCERVT